MLQFTVLNAEFVASLPHLKSEMWGTRHPVSMPHFNKSRAMAVTAVTPVAMVGA